MQRILAIFKLKLLLLRGNWAMLLMMTLSPILFTLIIGNMGSNDTGKITLYFADKDQSVISGEILSSFDREIYDVQVKEDTAIFEQVREEKIKTGYVIPAGFGDALQRGDTAEIQIVRLPQEMGQQDVQIMLNSIALRLRSADATSSLIIDTVEEYQGTLSSALRTEVYEQVKEIVNTEWAHPQVMSAFQQVTSNSNYEIDQRAQSSMGYLIFFLMFTLTFSISDILNDKQLGTWSRLLSTPTRSTEIIAGHFLGTMFIGAIQVTLLVSFGSLVMGVQWGRSPVGVFLMLFSLIFALTSLGLALAGFISSQRQLGALYPVLIVSTSMLGGCMWPLEIVPDFMRTVAAFIPQGQAMMGLTDLVVRGVSLTAALPHVLALLAMGALFFTLGVNRVQRVL